MKKKIEITPNLEILFGPKDENLYLIEDGFNVAIDLQSNGVQIEGTQENIVRAEQIFTDYEHLRRTGYVWHNGDLASMLKMVISDPTATLRGLAESGKQRHASSGSKRVVQPKSVHQKQYMEMIEQNDMVFGIGPAGTGKTYLAVAMAASALLNKTVSRIVLARPAVEAGERLGFLPGTLQEKVDPYLRPLYDALYDLMDAEKVDRFLEKNVIEIAPIAFMRGRTLNDAFIIMDEAQNTTVEQMKMFLTRMGNNSKAVITGDITQIDLPNAKRSGLVDAINVLKGVKGIGYTYFTEEDVVRHHLVQRIINAYERQRNEQQLDLQLEEKIPASGRVSRIAVEQ
jgi:phosphate starvation-inducible protein PhoH and related proteins